MAKKNSFTADMQKFLVACNDVEHVHYFSSSNVKKTEDRIAAAYQKQLKTGNGKYFRTGTALTVIDLFSESEWVERSAAEVRATEGAEVLKLAAEVGARANAYVVMTLHEAFEVFVRDVYGQLLYQLRQEYTLSPKQAFHKSRPKMAKVKGTLPYFRAYAKFECKRDCDAALSAMFSRLDMDSLTMKGWWGMPFEELIAVVGFCRHRVVHLGGLVSDDGLNALSTPQKTFVKSCLQKGVLTGDQRFLPGHETMKKLMNCLRAWCTRSMCRSRGDAI